jgi:hypothetical protein
MMLTSCADANAIARRVRGEFDEMPGLKLTPAQAQRFLGLGGPACEELLRELVAERFLRRTSDGAYVRLSDGA